ncbi:hypothetical protein AcW1_008314 [Taiwanofungus camphoratus]|nr:hypothetical protein AcW1_008314 [Antrodia cinnamomea]
MNTTARERLVQRERWIGVPSPGAAAWTCGRSGQWLDARFSASSGGSPALAVLVPKLLRAICCAVLMTGRRPIATSCEGTLENALSSQQLHQLQAVEAPKIQSFLSSLISISVCPTLLDNTRARAQIPPFINDHSIERTIREMRLVAPDRPMQSTGTHRPLTIL